MMVYVYEYFTKFVAGVMSCHVGPRPSSVMYGLIDWDGVVSPSSWIGVSRVSPVGLGLG